MARYHLSPGVYTKIIDLSEYLQDIPGSIAYIPVLSRRGPDNKMQFVSSNKQFFETYGKPNLSDYGKNYSQGMYIAANHVSVASSLFVMRCLPDDAEYANLFLALKWVNPATEESSSSEESALPIHAEIEAHSFTGCNTVAELDTILNRSAAEMTSEDNIENALAYLCYFRPIGRGDSYNDFSIRLSKHANTYLKNVYILDIFEKQTANNDSTDVVVETFNVSFDKNAVDESQESLYIEDVVNRFSKNVRCKVNEQALIELQAYSADYYRNDESDPYKTYWDANAEDGYKQQVIDLKKADLTDAEAALQAAINSMTAARALSQDTAEEVVARTNAIGSASTAIAEARTALQSAKLALEDALYLDILVPQDADTNTPIVSPIPLRYGSEGSLVTMIGDQKRIEPSTANQILSWGYKGWLENPETGLIEDSVTNTETTYFSLVYDGGYPRDVKYAGSYLASIDRQDCMFICDNGDTTTVEEALLKADGQSGGISMNTRYAARYEVYSKIYDDFTGRDIWISPVYHMAQIIPLTDMMYDVWYAPAGFNRATIETIKELRWNAKLGDRDNLYLKQLNPIIKFDVGYTVWGQLTTQKRPTALQDVNVMRMVLYIKRAIEQFCRYFIFDFNDSQTWDRIRANIIPFLEKIKMNRGLKNYSVSVGATDYEFKNKTCHVDVTLEPMKVIEKIELNLFVK